MPKQRRARIRLVATERVELERRVAARTSSQQDAYRAHIILRVADDQTVSYGVTADNSAFEQVMRVLKFVGNSTSLSSSDITNALDLASSALDATAAVQAKLSNSASQIESASARQSDYQSFAQTLSGDLTNVDVAAVTAQLSTYQAQLTASYSAIAKIQSMNLASYLK